MDLRGYFICYFLKIEDNGVIINLLGFNIFFDVGGKIMGINIEIFFDDLMV